MDWLIGEFIDEKRPVLMGYPGVLARSAFGGFAVPGTVHRSDELLLRHRMFALSPIATDGADNIVGYHRCQSQTSTSEGGES